MLPPPTKPYQLVISNLQSRIKYDHEHENSNLWASETNKYLSLSSLKILIAEVQIDRSGND